MNQILYNSANTTDKKKVVVFVLCVLVCIVVCVSTLFAAINIKNTNIYNNVFISNIDVSGKSKEEAKKLIQEETMKYEDKKITLKLNESEYDIFLNELGFKVTNESEAIDEAYKYGRSETFIKNNYVILFSNFRNKEIELSYALDETAFNELVSKIANVNATVVSDDTYEMSGDSIVITKGQDGLKIDSEALEKSIIVAAISDATSVDIPIVDASSMKLDLDKIYDEICVLPQNASFTSGEKFEVIVDKTGVDFDIKAAKAEYANLKAGETMEIDLRVVEPKIKVADLNKELFKDVLATYSTTYDATETNRVKNLQTASERCNGTIVYPGEEFSFHKTIGTRTIANGYASAHSFAGGKVVNTVGGGICQVSSTLYNIVLKTDLEVTERKAHGMYVKYAEPSVDATIAEGSIDFKFKNNRNYPIMIESELKDGTLTMSILGIKEETDKVIEIESVVLETLSYSTVRENDSTMLKGTTKVVQEPVDGYISEAYKVVKDTDGNVISRTLISKDKYIPTNEIIKVGTKVQTPVVEPEPEKEPETPIEDDENERDLPPGWDSPESPYGK